MEMTSDVRGIPATAYRGAVRSFDAARFLPDLLLVVVTLWYAFLTWADIIIQVKIGGGGWLFGMARTRPACSSHVWFGTLSMASR